MNRPQHYQNTYRKQLLDKIESLESHVFSRKDLTSDHSNQGQLRLNRALRAFINAGLIIKVSHGLYAKAKKIVLPSGKKLVALRNSFESVAIETLNKLGIKWELGRAIQEYNRGETTQVPVVFSVKLLSRFRGAIGAEGRTILFEDGTNAR